MSIILNNINTASVGTFNVTTELAIAQNFVNKVGTAVSLSSVVVTMTPNFHPNGLSLNLYSNSGGTPTTLLYSLNGPAAGYGPQNYVFNTGSAYILSASLSYWLLLSETDPYSNGYNVNYTTGLFTGSSSGSVVRSYGYTGSSASFFTKTNWSSPNPNVNLQMTIDAS